MTGNDYPIDRLGFNAWRVRYEVQLVARYNRERVRFFTVGQWDDFCAREWNLQREREANVAREASFS